MLISKKYLSQDKPSTGILNSKKESNKEQNEMIILTIVNTIFNFYHEGINTEIFRDRKLEISPQYK